jgi:acetyl esterase/lipase
MKSGQTCEHPDRNEFCPGYVLGLAFFFAVLPAGVARGQVPADIEAKLQKIGPIVDAACTAKVYRPLMPPQEVADQYLEMQQTAKPSSQIPLYPGIIIERDLSFGPDPKDVVDVFHGEKGAELRTVLIYVPGGLGNKIEIQSKEANAFNDNIMRWATQNGMVGVMMQRHGQAPGSKADYYAGAKDVSAMLLWVEANIAKYQGNPDRMFIWAHSAGNGPLGIYAGHPELYGPKGIGVKGIVFMSGQFNILHSDASNPVQPSAPPAPGAPKFEVGATCGAGPMNANDGVLPGKTAGQAGGPNAAAAPVAGPGRGAAQPSQEELISRSSLPGLEKTDAKLFLASAEFDPGIVDAKPSNFNQALHDELCKLDGAKVTNGKGHCPILVVMKGESHMSQPFSVGSGDKTVSAPILGWIKGVK